MESRQTFSFQEDELSQVQAQMSAMSLPSSLPPSPYMCQQGTSPASPAFLTPSPHSTPCWPSPEHDAFSPIRGHFRAITGRGDDLELRPQSADGVRRNLFPSHVQDDTFVTNRNDPSAAPMMHYVTSNRQPMQVAESRSFFGFRPGRECKFCKNNGETGELYRSHVLRNPSTGQLICPVLRAHVCEICGATQDNAHTRNYCPALKAEKRLRYAIPVSLKKTKRQSDGQLRH